MKKLVWSGIVWMIALVLSVLPVYAAWVPAGLEGENVLSLAEDTSTATVWYAGTADGEVYQLTGSVWTLSNYGLPSGFAVQSLTIDPASPDTVYAGLDGSGIYKSTDGGASWFAAGLDNLSVRSVEIDPYNAAIFFAATGSGIFKSTDAGANWQAVSSPELDSVDIRKITLNPPDLTLSPLPAQTDIVYAAASGTGGLYKSTDGGSSWAKLDTAGNGVLSTNFTTVAVDPTQPAVVYAGTADAGMYKSSDAGNTWAEINIGLGNQNITTITFYPYSPTSILVGTAADGIYRTDTSGGNWYAWNDGNSATKVNAINFPTPQPASILAGTSDRVVSFDNSGIDLIVTAVTGPTTVDTDTDSTVSTPVTATVKNVGDGKAWNSSLVQVYLSADSTITTSDTYIGGVWMGALAAGAEATVTFTAAIPRGAAGTSTYYIGAIADASNSNPESDETNNALAGNQVTVTRTQVSPDLIVTAVSGPTSVNTGQQIPVTATVKNVGDGKAWNSSLVYVYLSADSTITTSDTYIGGVWMGALAAGGEATVTFTATIPLSLASGMYHIGAIADVTNNNPESDETNNALVGNTITIDSMVDLDQDGYGVPADCNDYDPLEHPGQLWYQDTDNDGYSDGVTMTQCSRPAGYKVASELNATSGDCDDNDSAVHPGATEIPLNGIDENCNGMDDDAAEPLAVILQPAAGSSTYYGETITFEGSTGTTIVEHAWYFDESLVSSQRTFSYSLLPVGTHTITYETKDSIGRWSEPVSRQVTVIHQSARVDLGLEWGDISFWQDGVEVTNPGENDPVTIRATIHNLSTETVSAPGSVSFYDTYVTGNQGQVLLGTTELPAIAPNGTATVEFYWTPDPLNPQPYYHLIQVTAAQDPSETYIDNNTATHHIVRGDRQAAGNVNIDVLNLSVSNQQQLYVGTRFTLSGYAQYHWQNGYLLPVLGGKVNIRLGDQTFETTTGSNGWFYQEVVMPLAPACYSLSVEVSDATISGQKQLSLCAVAIPYAGPDLTVYSIQLANGVAGLPETVYAYIANRGGDVASGSFTNHIEITGPTGESVFTDTTTYANAGGIAAGSGVTIPFAGWTPAAPGYYRVTVTTDYDNSVAESSESNNTTSVTLYVYPYAVDLEVAELRQACNIVSARIVNHGGLNSSTGTLRFADAAGDFSTVSLPAIAGKGGTVWVNAAPYGGSSAGTPITATIASTEDVVASNNSRTAVFDFTSRSDLTVTNLKVNDQSWWGANTAYVSLPNTLWAEVRNLGCSEADGTLQFSVDGTAEGGTVTVPAIPGGGTAVVSTAFDFAGYTAGTNYTLAAAVTISPSYTDAVPGNNTLAETLSISPQLPDYRVTSGDIHFSVDPGHPARNEKFVISADIHNVGLAEGNEFQVAFYEEGQSLIGAVQTISITPGLQPGGSLTVYPRDVSGNIVEWGNSFSGNHAILVVVAPLTGIENDPNDADNSATRKVWVNYPPQAQLNATSISTATVEFSAAGSNDNLDIDGKGGIIRYDWDFGDGTTAFDAGPVVNHTYVAGGNYTATVTVVDNNNESTTASVAAAVPYTITASAGPGGSITPWGETAVAPGWSQSFVITPDAGYHILSVEGCGGTLAGDTYTTVPATGDCTVTANFERDTYTLMVATSGNGAVTSSPAGVDCGDDSVCMAIYENGTSVTLTASSDADSYFAGWGEACAGTGSCTVGMNSDTTVTAEFKQYIKVTAPNGGDAWDRGTTQTIAWKYNGDNGTSVKIELVKGATVVETIAENVPIGSDGAGSYNWTVPASQAAGRDYRIKITSTLNADHTDLSNGGFTIP